MLDAAGGDDRRVFGKPREPPLTDDDVAAIIRTLMDIRHKVSEMHRVLLEDVDGEEEADA